MIQKPDEPYPDFRSHREYPDLRSVDIAIGRAWLRLGIYRERGESTVTQARVIDRLLDRRLVLMAERDGVPA